MTHSILHFLVQTNSSLLAWLQMQLTTTETDALALLQFGGVYVNKTRTTCDHPLQVGDYVRVHTQPKRYQAFQNLKPQVCHHTNEFVVVHKPPGLPVHPMLDNLQENVQAQVEQQLRTKLWVTHRLDIPTEGLILYAKSAQFANAFNQLLQTSQVTKHYVALTTRPAVSSAEIGTELCHYMAPSLSGRKLLSKQPETGYSQCLLKILDITPIDHHLYQQRIQLITGRTHQIRAQLSFLGAPILNDQLYDSDWQHPQTHNPDSMIALRCVRLAFPHPNGSSNFVTFEIPDYVQAPHPFLLPSN